MTPNGTPVRGQNINVRLFWQAHTVPATDYTAFVHLVGPDGALVQPVDKPPLQGFLPTSTWYPGQRVFDDFVLTLPADAKPGTYTLQTGFYDPTTVTRLPITQDGKSAGDSFMAGTLTLPQ